MSNAKRIQKKVAKLEKRKYKMPLRIVIKLDISKCIEAFTKMKEYFIEMINVINNIKFKHEQL